MRGQFNCAMNMPSWFGGFKRIRSNCHRIIIACITEWTSGSSGSSFGIYHHRTRHAAPLTHRVGERKCEVRVGWHLFAAADGVFGWRGRYCLRSTAAIAGLGGGLRQPPLATAWWRGDPATSVWSHLPHPWQLADIVDLIGSHEILEDC